MSDKLQALFIKKYFGNHIACSTTSDFAVSTPQYEQLSNDLLIMLIFNYLYAIIQTDTIVANIRKKEKKHENAEIQRKFYKNRVTPCDPHCFSKPSDVVRDAS